MKEGLLFCDKLHLNRSGAVTSGVKGALLAIAQYAGDKALAKAFIKAMCDDEYSPVAATKAEKVLQAYRSMLQTGAFGGSGGGGGATLAKFEAGLSTYVNFANLSRGRKVPTESFMSIGQFIETMNSLPAKKA